jgi:hypothetical protein
MKTRQLATAAALMLGAVAAYALPTAVSLDGVYLPDLTSLFSAEGNTGGLLELGLAALGVAWFVLRRQRGG